MIERRSGSDGRPRYRVRIYRNSRYVVGRTFTRRADAVQWEADQNRALSLGQWSDPRLGELSVQEWCERWSAAQQHRAPGTVIKRRSLIDRQIVSEFGRRPLRSVKPSEVAVWAARLAHEQSASTARQTVSILSRTYEFAMADGVVSKNPCAGLKLPRAGGNEPNPLTHTELWALADSMPSPRFRVLILVAGYCGLRWGELAGLQWGDLRDDCSLIWVRRAASERLPAGEFQAPKSHSARQVPVPVIVAAELMAYRPRQTEVTELVFPSRYNTPLRNGNFRNKVFDQRVSSLGLDITPHNLRDTAASLAIQAGASVVAVARMLGHKDAATTLRYYAGYFPSDLSDLAHALDGAARAELQKVADAHCLATDPVPTKVEGRD